MEEFKISFGAELSSKAKTQLRKDAKSIASKINIELNAEIKPSLSQNSKNLIQKQIKELVKDQTINVNVGVNQGSLTKMQNQILSQLAKLNSLNAKIDILSNFDNESVQAKVTSLKTQIQSLQNVNITDNASLNTYATKLTELDGQYKLLINDVTRLKQESKTTSNEGFESKQIKAINDVSAYINNNSKAARQFGSQLNAVKERMEQVTDISGLRKVQAEFATVRSEIKATGLEGRNLGQELTNAMSKFTNWIGASTIIMQSYRAIRNAFTSIYQMDTALVDLRKTSDATNEQLKEFYYTANDTGKKLGETTTSIIEATSSWSRLGYSIKEASELAQTSSILSSISPEMNIEDSTDGLIASIKAFKIEADDALDGVASKINAIGNTQPVDNNDIINILTRSASAMAEANNTIDQTIALGTAANSVVRNAESVGTALKTTSLRIRGYDEEVESYTSELQNLSGTIADLTKTASTPGGISLFTDESKQTYKSTYQTFKDISGIYDQLTDKTQASLLEALAGKRQANIVAALISNFDMVEESLETMENSAGGAMQEMEVIYDSMEYKLNRLRETGVGIFQNILDSDAIKGGIDLLSGLLELLDAITSTLGALGSISVIGGGILTAKGLGWVNLYSCRQLCPDKA